MRGTGSSPQLVRGIGLLGATSANMINMIGVGPFLTIPLIIASMDGPQAMLGWILGAIVAICDGLVWAELGAAMPDTGGPYHYLLEAFGPKSLGKLMRFLFLWETVTVAPLIIASGAVGFSQYLKYLWPGITLVEGKLLAMVVCLVAMALLYRGIHRVGRLSVILWIVVLGTVGWITLSGLLNFHVDRVLTFPPGAFRLNRKFFFGLGAATLIAMYDFGGYNNVCFFAGEVKDPGRTIPRSILLSVIGVAAIYLTMNVTILSVVPWQEAAKSEAIVSTVIQRLYGNTAAHVVTVLILWTAFASVFAVMLGYSRVPFAAAVDGNFFAPFARLHPTKHFPTFSLVFTGITSCIACLLDLESLVKALIVIQIMIQFLAQVVAVTLIRRYRKDILRPFAMWAYPVTSVIAFGGWLYILLVSGWQFILAGAALILAGIGAYLWRAKTLKEWPYAS
jgi:amino acid transporter